MLFESLSLSMCLIQTHTSIDHRYGTEDASEEDMIRAAKQARAHDFIIKDFPEGYDTRVGERGLRISGGQRQRIAIARALLRKPKILLLDEATSALDNQTESDVLQALEIVGRRCTTLVIAHRLSTIQRCDRIFEFANGRLVASGSFEELRRKSPSFERLVKIENTGSL